MTEQAYTPPDTNVEQDDEDDEEESELEIEPEVYPAWCGEPEKRRAFLIECFAPIAGELSLDAYKKLLKWTESYLEHGLSETANIVPVKK